MVKFCNGGLSSGAPRDEKEEFGIEGMDETGRNMAYTTFRKISQYILDAFDMLANTKDKEVFIDYLLTNTKLYFDKFESELQNTVNEPDSPEELIRDEEEQILERAEEGKASNEVARKGQIDSEAKQDAGEGKKEALAEKEVAQKVTKSKAVPPAPATTTAEVDFSSDALATEDVAESTAIIGLLGILITSMITLILRNFLA